MIRNLSLWVLLALLGWVTGRSVANLQGGTPDIASTGPAVSGSRPPVPEEPKALQALQAIQAALPLPVASRDAGRYRAELESGDAGRVGLAFEALALMGKDPIEEAARAWGTIREADGNGYEHGGRHVFIDVGKAERRLRPLAEALFRQVGGARFDAFLLARTLEDAALAQESDGCGLDQNPLWTVNPGPGDPAVVEALVKARFERPASSFYADVRAEEYLLAHRAFSLPPAATAEILARFRSGLPPAGRFGEVDPLPWMRAKMLLRNPGPESQALWACVADAIRPGPASDLRSGFALELLCETPRPQDPGERAARAASLAKLLERQIPESPGNAVRLIRPFTALLGDEGVRSLEPLTACSDRQVRRMAVMAMGYGFREARLGTDPPPEDPRMSEVLAGIARKDADPAIRAIALDAALWRAPAPATESLLADLLSMARETGQVREGGGLDHVLRDPARSAWSPACLARLADALVSASGPNADAERQVCVALIAGSSSPNAGWTLVQAYGHADGAGRDAVLSRISAKPELLDQIETLETDPDRLAAIRLLRAQKALVPP